MGKKDTNKLGGTTPVDVVQKNNPLVQGIADIAKISEKWHKRWPNIDQPWPVEGTLNPEVIKIMQVLVATYKVDQKKGNKGKKRREKRKVELAFLKLFEEEGQKLITAASVMYPKKVYPQFPVSSQKGRHQISENDLEEDKGGCDPKAKWMLARAEKREDSEEEDSNEEDSRMTLSEVRDLQMKKEELLKKGSQLSGMRSRLQSNKVSAPGSMLPVIIREHGFEYRPLQSTDMSIIIEKLPIIQDGAHPWISKLDELLIGQLPAMGDIKKILANIVGVNVLGEILQKAGLNQYVGTSVNDSDLFAASRGQMCRALKVTFPTNVHPDNIIIQPLGEEENPRAFVSRSHQVWMNVTGNDLDLRRMDQSILRTKILMGLPIAVRNKVKEVVGLGNMKNSVYTDHIAHQVELYRKRGDDLKEQDRETLRKLNHLQLVSDKVESKQALAMKNQDPPNQPVPQPEPRQTEIQSFYPQPAFDHEQYWSGSELEGQYYTHGCDCNEGSCFCY